MKTFIDTNIFLDLLLKRTYYKEALEILNYCSNHKYKTYILDITILNIDYIAKKQVKDLREFLKLINENFIIIGGSNKLFDDALKMDNNDLEDNLQYYSAYKEKCDIIITNDKGFINKQIPLLTSSEFVEKFIK